MPNIAKRPPRPKAAASPPRPKGITSPPRPARKPVRARVSGIKTKGMMRSKALTRKTKLILTEI